MIYNGWLRLPKSALAAGTGDSDSGWDVRRTHVDHRRRGDVGVEFERRLARGRQNL